MEAFFIYLLKVSVSTFILYLSYHLLLRKYKSFEFNRIFLLLILPIAHVIPWIQIPVKEEGYATTVLISEINSIASNSNEIFLQTNPNETIKWTILLAIIYSIGIIFQFGRFILSYCQALKLYKSAVKHQVKAQTVYLSKENIRAFTFIDKIIIGRNILNHPDIAMVIDHEKVHLVEKHFIDLFLIELLSPIQWFNPATHILNKAIRLNLEYQVDAKIVQKSNMRQYQNTLISMVYNRMVLPQFTELNSNNLKNRILMMKSPNNSKFSSIRKMALLPIILILFASFSQKKPTYKANEFIETGLKTSENALIKDKKLNKEINTINDLNKYFSRSLRYPKEARKFGQVGSVKLF